MKAFNWKWVYRSNPAAGRELKHGSIDDGLAAFQPRIGKPVSREGSVKIGSHLGAPLLQQGKHFLSAFIEFQRLKFFKSYNFLPRK